jgi:hypothetical protein
MSATVISFPVQTKCPCCGRACGEDELSACYRCGEKFCGSAKTNCRSICDCDRLADHLHAVRELRDKPGLLTRLWQAVTA